ACGNDVWLWPGNVDFYNNTVQGHRRSTYTNACPGVSQHSDIFQSGNSSNINFYNNTIIDPGESIYYEDSGSSGTVSNINIYNNLIVRTYACTSVERGFDMNPEGAASGTVAYVDMVIANNTVIDGFCNFFTRISGAGSYTRAYVVNNLEYPSGNGISVDTGVTVSNNYSGNSAQFVSYSHFGGTSNDLHLTSSDTVARGRGRDMSTYFSTDKDGKPRPSGAWDIGAYQYSGSGSTSVSPPTSLSAVIK